MYYLILNKNVRPALSDIKSSWRGHAIRRGTWAPLSGRKKYLDWFRVNSDPNQLGPCYKQCPSWFTAVSDLVMVE